MFEVKVWSNLIGSKSDITSANSMEQILNPVPRMISRPPDHEIYPKNQRQKTALISVASFQKLLMSPLLTLLSREPLPVGTEISLANPDDSILGGRTWKGTFCRHPRRSRARFVHHLSMVLQMRCAVQYHVAPGMGARDWLTVGMVAEMLAMEVLLEVAASRKSL